MKRLQNIVLPILSVVSLCISSPLLANESQDDSRNGGFLKLGYGYNYETSPYHERDDEFQLYASGRYQYEGLFVELTHGANELNQGLNFGYNLFNYDNWSFDLASIQAHGDTGFDVATQFSKDGPIERISIFRDDSFMLGFRATGGFDDSNVQFTVAPYSFNDDYDDGVFASLWLNRSWQVRNWEVHAALGIKYRSSGILNHYYGISPEQAIELFPVYSAGSGVDYTGQLGFSYPLTQNWLFEGYYRYTGLSSSISDSPMMQFTSTLKTRSKDISEFGFLVSYVF